MLNKNIRKAIIEAKDKKETLLIEENLVKSRLMVIFESEKNISNFNKLNKKTKDKISDSLIREIHFLSQNNILNEGLMDYLTTIFGKNPLSNIFETIVERIVGKALTAIGMEDGFLKNFIVSFIASDPRKFASALKDCNTLSTLITDALSEAIVKMMQESIGAKGGVYDFIRNSLGDAITGTQFKQNIQKSINSFVCKTYNDFTGKAGNVLSNLKNTGITAS